MGNSNVKDKNSVVESETQATKDYRIRPKQRNISTSFDNLLDRVNLSFRKLSFTGAAVRSHSLTSQSSRPWSRVSKKRWSEKTLDNPQNRLKTCWPVSHIESIFLPQFKIENLDRNYTIVEYIARGAFGKVYKVQEKSSGKVYALKILCKSQIIIGNSVKQSKDEVDIQTICGHHPFIVQCFDYWQNKKKVFLLSEYISNGEIFQKIKSFSYELVQLYVAEIATALDFLHNAGIIFRDLKPENILLDTEYHIKIIDFGFSKWLSIGSKTKTMCGTMQYMAPELLNGEPYGHAVDWWALGVIACRMLINEYPNIELLLLPISKDEPDDAGQIAPKKYTILPDSAQELRSESRDLLQRLFEKNPQFRLKSLMMLQRIALYKNYNWNNIKLKKTSPKQFIKEDDAIIDHHFAGF